MEAESRLLVLGAEDIFVPDPMVQLLVQSGYHGGGKLFNILEGYDIGQGDQGDSEYHPENLLGIVLAFALADDPERTKKILARFPLPLIDGAKELICNAVQECRILLLSFTPGLAKAIHNQLTDEGLRGIEGVAVEASSINLPWLVEGMADLEARVCLSEAWQREGLTSLKLAADWLLKHAAKAAPLILDPLVEAIRDLGWFEGPIDALAGERVFQALESARKQGGASWRRVLAIFSPPYIVAAKGVRAMGGLTLAYQTRSRALLQVVDCAATALKPTSLLPLISEFGQRGKSVQNFIKRWWNGEGWYMGEISEAFANRDPGEALNIFRKHDCLSFIWLGNGGERLSRIVALHRAAREAAAGFRRITFPT